MQNVILRIRDLIYSKMLIIGKMIYYNRYSKVIYYHDIHFDTGLLATPDSTPVSLFKKHIETIRANGFEIVSEISKLENQIKITFDDGYCGIYGMKDYFIEEKIYPTVFIVSNFINKEGYLTESEILELDSVGFSFQSHTKTHYTLNVLDTDTLDEELSFAKNSIEQLTKKQVNDLCFPRGYFNEDVIEKAYFKGYSGLYSSLPGYYYEKNNLGVVYRNFVQRLTCSDLKSVLFGGSTIFRRRLLIKHKN